MTIANYKSHASRFDRFMQSILFLDFAIERSVVHILLVLSGGGGGLGSLTVITASAAASAAAIISSARTVALISDDNLAERALRQPTRRSHRLYPEQRYEQYGAQRDSWARE